MPHDQGPLSFWYIVVFITAPCSPFVRHCQPVVLVQPETAKTLKWADGLVRFFCRFFFEWILTEWCRW
jgi:hypothetical protein